MKDVPIPLEPTQKVGYAKNYLGDRDHTELNTVQENLEIVRRNGERIIENPIIALEAISYHKAVFTKEDIWKLANTHSADAEQFNKVCEAIEGSPELINLGKNDNEKYRFTTKATLELERQMLDDAAIMAGEKRHRVNERSLKQAEATRTLTDEQISALNHVVNSGDVTAVIGHAGTGKSYTLGAVREAYESAGYRIRGMALSGIAAEALERESGIRSKTIHSTLWEIEKGYVNLTEKDVLILDEAGMIGTRQMQKIISYAKGAKAKVVLVGDHYQLQPIEACGAFRGILERIGYQNLEDIMRQRLPWMKEASRDFATGNIYLGIDRYYKNQRIRTYESFNQAREHLVYAWKNYQRSLVASGKEETSIILAYRNKDVKKLNQMAPAAKKEAGHLGEKEHEFKTARGKRQFSEGDRVLFLRNERSLGVKNGSLGTIEKISRSGVQVRLDTGERIAFDPHLYKHFDLGYAATVHKTQGVTVDRAFVLATRHFDRHTAYVAMTRHRHDLHVYFSKDHEGFKDLARMKQVMSKDRPKDLVIDYAKARGIEPEKIHPATPLTQAEREYIDRMDAQGFHVKLVTKGSAKGLYVGKETVDGVVYARLEYGNTRYLIPHRQAFDRHFMKAVEFDGHAFNPSNQLQKEIRAMKLHERSRSIEFNKDLAR